VVAIVDAYSSARYLAPLFQAQGYECVHVQSTPAIPAGYEQSFRATDFTANIIHDGDVAGTVAALARHAPRSRTC
jgi:hypothetical protein